MDPASIAAIVVGAVSLIGNLVSTGVNVHQQNKTNQQSMDFARESAETAQKNTKDLMDYNSPSYQMGRIVSAGLNPNLAYQNLDTPIPTGAQPSQPSLKAPQVNFNSGLNDALALSQINRLNVAADNESAETDAKVKLMYKDLGLKDAQIDVLYKQAEELVQSVLESQARISLMNEEQRTRQLDNWFKQDTFNDRVKTVASERSITETKADYEERYIAASILHLKEQAHFYKNKANLTSKEADMLTSLKELYDANTTNVGIHNRIDEQAAQGAERQTIYNGQTYTYGELGIVSSTKAKTFQAELIDIQSSLLAKYGPTEANLRLLESLSRSFYNFSAGASYWIPMRSKTVEYGNIKKGITGHFIGQ